LPLRFPHRDRLRALDNQDGNAIDDGIGAAACDADEMHAVEAQVAKTGRAGQLRKHCGIERGRKRRFVNPGNHKSPISELLDRSVGAGVLIGARLGPAREGLLNALVGAGARELVGDADAVVDGDVV
jgi:hypothetical protein